MRFDIAIKKHPTDGWKFIIEFIDRMTESVQGSMTCDSIDIYGPTFLNWMKVYASVEDMEVLEFSPAHVYYNSKEIDMDYLTFRGFKNAEDEWNGLCKDEGRDGE